MAVDDIEAHIESLTLWGASGWAWKPSEPDIPVTVEALADDGVICATQACHLRPDVAKSGRGSGYCGFELLFRDPLVRGQPTVGP